MSLIRANFEELDKIRMELKNLTLKRKNLKNRENAILADIQKYLTEKNLPGVKYKDFVVILENKQTRRRKKPADQNSDTMEILSRYGITDPEILQEILDSRKGEPEDIQKIKIKKTKKDGN